MIVEFVVFWFIILLTFCIGFFVGFLKFVKDSPEVIKNQLEKGLSLSKAIYKNKEGKQEEDEVGYAQEITEEERDRRLHPERYTYEEAESTKILKEKLLNKRG